MRDPVKSGVARFLFAERGRRQLGMRIVRDPVREGSYAARIEIRPGDNCPGLNRVEISTTQPASTMQENAETFGVRSANGSCGSKQP